MRASYPTYKSTSIPWMPEMPEHWDVRRAKYIFKVIDDKTAKGDEELLSVSEHHGVIPRRHANVNTFKAESYEGYKLCKKGDLVINSLWAWSRGLGVAEHEGIISNAYSVYRLKIPASSRYLHYLLRTEAYVAEYLKRSKGIWISRLQLSDQQFLDLQIPLPPLPEQIVIANYLDAKTEQINRFIEKKEKLIRSLREKIDVIVQSVEDEPLNESKFWPTIPQTWRIEKAKRIFSEIKIKNQPTEPLLAATQDRGVLPKDICTENFVSPSGDLSGLKLVCEDDYVISLRSFQGGIEYSPYRGIISPAYTIIRLKEDYNNPLIIQYYKYLFKTPQFISLLNTAITGIRDGKNVNWVDFAELPIPIPSVEHLKLMVEDFNRYEKLVIVFEKEKRKLEEFKNSLISEVVTGKIKVA